MVSKKIVFLSYVIIKITYQNVVEEFQVQKLNISINIYKQWVLVSLSNRVFCGCTGLD